MSDDPVDTAIAECRERHGLSDDDDVVVARNAYETVIGAWPARATLLGVQRSVPVVERGDEHEDEQGDTGGE